MIGATIPYAMLDKNVAMIIYQKRMFIAVFFNSKF